MCDQNSIPVDSLELLRNRLHQVHQSLRKLADQIGYFNRKPAAKLPSYLALHGQFQVLITQLHSTASHLKLHGNVLRSTNAYPLPAFPSTQHESLVTTLLRKKPLPEVDEWVEQAAADFSLFRLPLLQDDELAEWCYSKVKQLESDFVFDGFYTEKEEMYKESEGQRKSVRKSEESEARQDREPAVAGDQPPMQPNAVLKFMTKGT
ncbi:hypothetical protein METBISCDRAFT_27106 [Metschnikowia bicuspidata]|uniref:Mediator of RNA polymerase II transcription subunit 8 n=1 Tax=Metschnikowia bicuspidata TaxID=27322 RepID=A0A4P9ZDK5_9ASCO|nr:hypothetical protein METBISCDRAFT_27106 [Metschnikowia bicuspidata]